MTDSLKKLLLDLHGLPFGGFTLAQAVDEQMYSQPEEAVILRQSLNDLANTLNETNRQILRVRHLAGNILALAEDAALTHLTADQINGRLRGSGLSRRDLTPREIKELCSVIVGVALKDLSGPDSQTAALWTLVDMGIVEASASAFHLSDVARASLKGEHTPAPPTPKPRSRRTQ